MKTSKNYNRIYTPLNKLGPIATPEGGTPIVLFIRQPDESYAVHETTPTAGAFRSVEYVDAGTLYCRESTLRLSGRAFSIWDGKQWEHTEARKAVITRAQRAASLFGEEDEPCTCPGPEGVVSFNCPSHGCPPPPESEMVFAPVETVDLPPKKTAADLF